MTYQLRDLKDQVVVITGATAGMGAATAKELVEQGAKVVLNARNEARLKQPRSVRTHIWTLWSINQQS